jgi:hypothetical protein
MLAQGICSCIYCRKEYSINGIFVHVDRAHLNKTHYSSGFNGTYLRESKKAQIARAKQEEEYNHAPKLCQCCNISLTYAQRKNKYCSSSCAAKINNASRDFNVVKVGPKPTIKTPNTKCLQCSVMFVARTTTHKFCSTRCASHFKNAPLRAKRSEFVNYRADCSFKFSLSDYPDEFDFSLIKQHGWYKAKNHGNNLNGVSRDHIVSVKYGFKNGIPANVISHPANCQLLQHNANVSKNSRCEISINELYNKINLWEKKYNK